MNDKMVQQVHDFSYIGFNIPQKYDKTDKDNKSGGELSRKLRPTSGCDAKEEKEDKDNT
jgi:hypothetical protein